MRKISLIDKSHSPLLPLKNGPCCLPFLIFPSGLKMVKYYNTVVTTGKNNLFRKSNARDNELRHENGCVKSSSQLRGEHCKSSSDFFPSECPGLCRT